MTNGIGTLKERSLHAELKNWYTKPGDLVEHRVDGYVIDIVHEDLLIEIQTKNLSALRKKIKKLSFNHEILLVHPIIADKWIINEDINGLRAKKRKSPRHCSYLDIFNELVHAPDIISSSNVVLELILVQVEEIRRDDGKGSWRRKGKSIKDKRLINVLEKKRFKDPEELLDFIPKGIPLPFTNKDLAKKLKHSISLAQKMTYSLRKMGVLDVVGKQGNAILHSFDLN